MPKKQSDQYNRLKELLKLKVPTCYDASIMRSLCLTYAEKLGICLVSCTVISNKDNICSGVMIKEEGKRARRLKFE